MYHVPVPVVMETELRSVFWCFSVSCSSSVSARGGSSLCAGPTSGRCIVTSSPERWEASRGSGGSARTTLTSSARLSRCVHRELVSVCSPHVSQVATAARVITVNRTHVGAHYSD